MIEVVRKVVGRYDYKVLGRDTDSISNYNNIYVTYITQTRKFNFEDIITIYCVFV